MKSTCDGQTKSTNALADVCCATSQMIGGSGPGRCWEFFLFTIVSKPALGPTESHIQRVTGALSLGLKRPGRGADHWPPSSAEIKNAWIYTSAHQYAFMAWCSVKAFVKTEQKILYLW